jgi:hypothetical protein
VIKVSPLTFMILHIPETCVIMCVCVCAEYNGEDTSRDLGENGQEVI